jgi:methylated-DNA-protein-cysteine methyltransferase-like protein
MERHMGRCTRTSRIYEAIRHIPRGRVATYGQIARLAGIPGHARQVGYALHRLPHESDVPWHRVINEKGRISLHSERSGALQQSILESEGIVFDAEGTIPLRKYRWQA